jgi:hypothetical protein
VAVPSIADALQRLKTLIDSSTPIVVMETVEEMRAVRMVRSACAALNLATFEWSVASGLMRCGSTVGEVVTGGYDFTDHSLPGYARRKFKRCANGPRPELCPRRLAMQARLRSDVRQESRWC